MMFSMKGAKGVIVNITGGYDMTLFEVDGACNRIRDEVDPDANIIFGSTFDESLEGTIRCLWLSQRVLMRLWVKTRFDDGSWFYRWVLCWSYQARCVCCAAW